MNNTAFLIQFIWKVNVMKRSFETNNGCDLNGVLYIPTDIPDIVENILNLPPLPPTKLADNLYFIGTAFVGTIVLNTEEGIVLIDAMNSERDGEKIIFPGLRELGLNPLDIKKLIITHGHVDHYGAAKYIKEKTGCTVYMTEIDHKMLRDIIVPLGDERIIQGAACDPGIDCYIKDGDIIRCGTAEIKVVFTPGHTPGGISLIFPVKAGNEIHYAGVWGGTKIPATVKDSEEYLCSIQHFIDECKKMHVDISIQAHPFVDYSLDKGIFCGNELYDSKRYKNPIILGEERFQLFLQCIKAYAVGNTEKMKK